MLSTAKTPLKSLLSHVVSGSVKASRSLTNKPFYYQELFEHAKPLDTPFKKLTGMKLFLKQQLIISLINYKISGDFVSTFEVKGKKCLQVESEALTMLSEQAMIDIAHLLRPAHLQSLSNIISDSESSENDRFVALELLKNANIAANMILPGCQDTGTHSNQ